MVDPDRPGDDIHRRLLAGDATAPHDLWLAYYDPLADLLVARNPHADPHLCQEAAEEALRSFIKNPAAYRPERLPLLAYLKMAARGDLLNLLARDRRRRMHELPLDPVELPELRRNTGQDDDPAAVVEEADERSEEVVRAQRILDVVADGLSPEEIEVLHLMVFDRERRSAVYARVLHITHLPLPEQRKIVHQTKDRLQKRLRREAEAHV